MNTILREDSQPSYPADLHVGFNADCTSSAAFYTAFLARKAAAKASETVDDDDE
jgi:hypothetical protein